jgi:hypothetical protein
MSATHSFDFARLQLVEGFEYGWNQGAKVVNVVARRSHDHDTDCEAGQVLLVFDALVDR